MAPQSLPGQAERQLRRFVSLGSPQAAGILGAYPERALKLAAVQGLLADHRSQQTQHGLPDGTAREQLGQKAATFRSWNRTTYVALVRYQSPLFQDQLQTPHVGDVLERIGADNNQVGELAHLHRAQFGADAAYRGGMARGPD